MLPSPRHREARRSVGSACVSSLGQNALGVAHSRAAAPPPFAADAGCSTRALLPLPWRSGDLWRVVSAARPSIDTANDDEASCRFCFGGADAEDGGELLEPCSCAGSQRCVHERCLRAWQELCLLNGAADKARYCDVCRGLFSSPPVRLPRHQQAWVSLKCVALHAARAWVLATTVACAAGTAGGLLASANVLARALGRLIPWLDSRAASSASFAMLASLALPVAVPAAALAAGAVVFFHATFGAVFGFILGAAGGPMLLAHVVAALCRTTARAAEASAALAFAAAAAATKGR